MANLISNEAPEKADDFMEAFQNFAMTAITNKTTISQLVQANTKLVEANKKLTDQVEMLQK